MSLQHNAIQETIRDRHVCLRDEKMLSPPLNPAKKLPEDSGMPERRLYIRSPWVFETAEF